MATAMTTVCTSSFWKNEENPPSVLASLDDPLLPSVTLGAEGGALSALSASPSDAATAVVRRSWVLLRMPNLTDDIAPVFGIGRVALPHIRTSGLSGVHLAWTGFE